MRPFIGKLHIGIQTLREIRQEGYLYVDKTSHLLEMVTQGKAYFLFRPAPLRQ